MTYILYNPRAGYGDKAKAAESIAHRFEGEVVIKDATAVADYAAFVAPLTAEDTVVLCGGDGTLNRFANAVQDTDYACDVLYYAVGTGNDFLHDLGLEPGAAPFSVKKYLQNLPSVEINGKHYRFLNGIGFGIDGYCCAEGDRQKAMSDKPVNYTGIAIKGMLYAYKPRTATVTVDGVTHVYKKAWIAATMKGRFYGGGMMTAPAQDRLAEDGEVTLVLFHGKGRLKTLIVFPSIFKGEHVNHPEMVAVHTGKDITVTYDCPAPLQVDGDTVLDVLSYHVTAGKLKIETAEVKKVATV